MNATLSTTVSSDPARHENPPQPVSPHAARRVGLLDRAALHLGVALITWSRRPLEIETRERLVRRNELRRARLDRELAWQRELLLSAPRR